MGKLKKSVNCQLGKALMNKIDKKKTNFLPKTIEAGKFIHMDNQPVDLTKNLQSVIDQDNLEEFLHIAELQDKNFKAERGIAISRENVDKHIIIDS